MSAPARDAKRQDRRDAILDVARDCFAAEGYGATSMSTIAGRLGGSKGTLYNYFKSKEELFEAVVRRSCEQLAASLFEVADQGNDPRERLVRLARAFLGFLTSPDVLAIQRLVVAEAERLPELGRAFYAAGPKLVIGRLAELIEGLMRQGVLRQDDPLVAAQQFKDLAVSGVHQLRLWSVIDDLTPAEIETRAIRAVDTFLRAYRP